MPNRIISSRLAARAGTRQVEASVRADQVGGVGDRAVAAIWAKLLAILRTARTSAEAFSLTLALLHPAGHGPPTLYVAAHQAIAGELGAMATWGHQSAVQAILDTVPTHYLRAAAAGIVEGRKPGRAQLQEAGGVALSLTPSPLGLDLLAPLREPARDRLTDDEQRDLFARLLFPAPSQERVDQVVYGTRPGMVPWQQRLAAATKIPTATPEVLARTLATGYAAGKTQRQIAQDLLPAVNGVKSAARRIARTEGLRVAHDVQMDAYRGLGDMIEGWQIHAVLDLVTRPEHRHRNGTIFWRQPDGRYLSDEPVPGPPGKLTREMPHPPQEGDGSTAWNCRCVTGKAIVHADVRWIMRSLYDGEAVEFRTRSGARLTVTANHPMATPSGFAPASVLRQGDHLLSDGCRGGQGTGDVEQQVAPIEDVFEALAVRWGCARLQRPSVLEFHGDGQAMQGEVEVVGPDLGLVFDAHPQLVQGEDQSDFVGRAAGPVCGTALACPLGVRHARPLEPLGVRSPAQRHAAFDEQPGQAKRFALRRTAAVDAAAGQPVSVSQCLEGFAGEIAFDEAGRALVALGQSDRLRFRAECDPASGQPGTNGVGLDATLPAELCQRRAGLIAADEIVHVRRLHLRAWVYSVDTGLGYYMGSDNTGPAVLQGNCFLTPVLKPPASIVNDPARMAVFTNAKDKLIPDPSVYQDWFARADERHRMVAVGARRYVTVKNLLGPGREPEYAHFVEPDTGELITAAQLRRETVAERAERVRQVQQVIQQRKQLVHDVATYGFLPPGAATTPPVQAPALPPPARPGASGPAPDTAFARVAGRAAEAAHWTVADRRRRAGLLRDVGRLDDAGAVAVWRHFWLNAPVAVRAQAPQSVAAVQDAMRHVWAYRDWMDAPPPPPGVAAATHAKKYLPALRQLPNTAFDLAEVDRPAVRQNLYEVAQMPVQALRVLGSNGVRMVMADAAVPELDDNKDLRGVHPRGHAAGETWDDVPGAYLPRKRQVLAGGGGKRHNSRSLALHEAGHALGDVQGWDDAPELIAHHRRLHPKLAPYYQQGGPGAAAGRQELFAEAVAVLLFKGEAWAVAEYDRPFVEWLKATVLRI